MNVLALVDHIRPVRATVSVQAQRLGSEGGMVGHPPDRGQVQVGKNVDAKAEVIVTTMASDSHTWNLIFLQLLLEEMGNQVTNLGPCVPDEVLVDECRMRHPALIVISSVNGHGCNDGMRVIRLLRSHAELEGTPIVIGGKLGVDGDADARYSGALLDAGFDAVFSDGAGLSPFRSFVNSLPARVTR